MPYTRRKYFVNTEIGADRQVHREDCTHLPLPDCRRYLGEFYSPMAAVAEALNTYPSAHHCKVCTPK